MPIFQMPKLKRPTARDESEAVKQMLLQNPYMQTPEMETSPEDIQAFINKDPKSMEIVDQLENEAGALPKLNNPGLPQPNEIDELYKPGESLQKTKEHLAKRPSMQDYKGNKLVAGLAAGFTGLSGAGAGQAATIGRGVLDNPYNKAEQEWESEGKALTDLGRIEDKEADNKRGAFSAKETQRHNTAAEESNRLKSDENKQYRKEQLELQKEKIENDREYKEGSLILRAEHNEVVKQLAQLNAGKKDNKDAFSQERQLRTAYDKEMGPLRSGDQSFAKIQSLGNSASGAEDIGMLYNFVKSLDDTAAKEGEVKLAQSARPLAQRLKTEFDRLTGSSRLLDANTVRQYVEAAKKIHNSMGPVKNKIRARHKQLAESYGLNSDRALGFDTDESSNKEEIITVNGKKIRVQRGGM